MSTYNEELYLEMVENEELENSTINVDNVSNAMLEDMFDF